MNWKKPLVFGIFYMLILAGCAIRPSEEEEKNSFEAAEEFTKVFNMAVLGSSTHDSTQVLEYIETEEGGKVLKELLQEDGIDPEAASSQCFWWGVGLDPFYDTTWFEDGDILLLRNYGDFASNLLDWLIPSMYTHCGVLKQQFSQG
ncbi:MAG: hypothetical protein AMS17_09620, partial [Spirochaetes bacterium DG_61]